MDTIKNESMSSIYNKTYNKDIIARINKISPETKTQCRKWDKLHRMHPDHHLRQFGV